MKAKNLELMNYSEKMMMMVWKLAKMLAVMKVNTTEMAKAYQTVWLKELPREMAKV